MTKEDVIEMIDEITVGIEEGTFDDNLDKLKDLIVARQKVLKEVNKEIEKESKLQSRKEKEVENKANTKVGDMIVISYGGQEDLPKEVMARVTGTSDKTCTFVVLNEDGTPFIRQIGGLSGKPLTVWKKWWAF